MESNWTSKFNRNWKGGEGEREREREWVRECGACVSLNQCMCVCMCVHVCVRERVGVCVCVCLSECFVMLPPLFSTLKKVPFLWKLGQQKILSRAQTFFFIQCPFFGLKKNRFGCLRLKINEFFSMSNCIFNAVNLNLLVHFDDTAGLWLLWYREVQHRFRSFLKIKTWDLSNLMSLISYVKFFKIGIRLFWINEQDHFVGCSIAQK